MIKTTITVHNAEKVGAETTTGTTHDPLKYTSSVWTDSRAAGVDPDHDPDIMNADQGRIHHGAKAHSDVTINAQHTYIFSK